MDKTGFDRARELVSRDSLVSILSKLVDVVSPTGEEGPLARQIVALLDNFDLSGEEQIIDDQQSNALGQIKGIEASKGTTLLLYAPIDTLSSSSAEEDLPWLGPELTLEMKAESHSDGRFVSGLGAHNPKGHAACIIEAARVLRASGAALKGDLILGFGAGGMPTNARAGTRQGSGHGAGCEHMLSNGPRPDCAVIAKSGWSVSWEEVGLIWFEVEVEGIHNYVGSRHLMPYVNPILEAGKLIEKLDGWFLDWAENHRSGLVAPQGVVSFIESGWKRMPAFTPAVCRFRVDLRLSPRTSPERAEQEFSSILAAYSAELNIKTKYKRLVAIPGTSTDPQAAVIAKAIESWEAIEQKKHQSVAGMSGATDANILRGQGVPTARIGLPKADLPDIDFQQGMNRVSVDDLYQLTLLLVDMVPRICNGKDGANTGEGCG